MRSWRKTKNDNTGSASVQADAELCFLQNKMKKLFLSLLVVAAMAACNDNQQNAEPADSENAPVTVGKAIAMLTDSIAMDSTRAELYQKRAQAYLANEQVGAAMIDINKALQVDPDNVDTYLLLADVYYLLGDESNISTTLNKAADIDPFDARPLVKLAELNLLQQNFKLSAAYIDKALKVESYNPKAYFVRGMYFITAEQDTANALKSFQLAFEQDGNFYDAAEQICRIYAVQEHPFTMDYLRFVQKKFPEQANARYELALYLQSHGKPDEALQHYDTLLMERPDNHILLFNLAYVHFIYLHNNEIALDYFDKALQVNPDYKDALYNKGRVLEQMGDYVKAMDVYKQVLFKDANYQLAIDAINRIQNQEVE